MRDDHAGYIANWIEVLKNDKRRIVQAVYAQKSLDYLHGLQPQTTAADHTFPLRIIGAEIDSLLRKTPPSLRQLTVRIDEMPHSPTKGSEIVDEFRFPRNAWRMRLCLILVFYVSPGSAQQTLLHEIRSIAADAHGKVSVACSLPATPLDCNLNPAARPPMQSVFKLPLALAILHQVEQGKFTLDQPILFQRSDLILPKPYSPLQDKYPEAGVDVPLRDLLQVTVSLSDNTAADILLRIAGGPRIVKGYIASLGVTGFQLRDGEGALHRDHSLQYRNWFEPQGAVRLLCMISDHSPLTAEHTALLLEWMRSSRASRLRLDLPEGSIVAHKSGTSEVDNGIAAATNDIGLITLPDGRQLAIAIFVTDSTATDEIRDKVIARIAKTVYDSATQKR